MGDDLGAMTDVSDPPSWPLRIDGCAYAAGATFGETGRVVLRPGTRLAIVLDDPGVTLVAPDGIAIEILWEALAGIDVRGPAGTRPGRFARVLGARDWCYLVLRLVDGTEVLAKVFDRDAASVEALVDAALTRSADPLPDPDPSPDPLPAGEADTGSL